MRYRLQLEEVGDVLVVDEGLGLGVVADAGADVVVQHGVGEAQIVLVTLVGETIRGGLLHQLDGQTQLLPYRLDFLHGESTQRRKVTSSIAIAGRIAHPVL